VEATDAADANATNIAKDPIQTVGRFAGRVMDSARG